MNSSKRGAVYGFKLQSLDLVSKPEVPGGGPGGNAFHGRGERLPGDAAGAFQPVKAEGGSGEGGLCPAGGVCFAYRRFEGPLRRRHVSLAALQTTARKPPAKQLNEVFTAVPVSWRYTRERRAPGESLCLEPAAPPPSDPFAFSPQLLETKSTDRKQTLLHYISNVVKEKYQHVSLFYNELHYVEKAAAGTVTLPCLAGSGGTRAVRGTSRHSTRGLRGSFSVGNCSRCAFGCLWSRRDAAVWGFIS